MREIPLVNARPREDALSINAMFSHPTDKYVQKRPEVFSIDITHRDTGNQHDRVCRRCDAPACCLRTPSRKLLLVNTAEKTDKVD